MGSQCNRASLPTGCWVSREAKVQQKQMCIPSVGLAPRVPFYQVLFQVKFKVQRASGVSAIGLWMGERIHVCAPFIEGRCCVPAPVGPGGGPQRSSVTCLTGGHGIGRGDENMRLEGPLGFCCQVLREVERRWLAPLHILLHVCEGWGAPGIGPVTLGTQ